MKPFGTTAYSRLKTQFGRTVKGDFFIGSAFVIKGANFGPKNENSAQGFILQREGKNLTIALLFQRARLFQVFEINKDLFFVKKHFNPDGKPYRQIDNIWEEGDITAETYKPLFTLMRKRPGIPKPDDVLEFKADIRLISEVQSIIEGPEDSLDLLLSDYRKARKAYMEGDPIMSDEEFDALENEIRRIDPENPELTKVGHKVEDDRARVALPIPMGSLTKLRPNGEGSQSVTKWVNSIPKGASFVQTKKFDGISIMLEYEAGKLVRAYKSADGIEGTLITQKIMLIPNLPKLIKTNKRIVRIRAEAIMRNSLFLERYSKRYKNVRNMIAGWFNTKVVNPQLQGFLRDVSLIAYTIMAPDSIDKVDQIPMLVDWGFETPAFKKLSRKDVTDSNLTQILNEEKSNTDYDMDGIVIDVNEAPIRKKLGMDASSINPKASRAFKVGGENLFDTTVKSVEWNISKTGKLKPRVNIKPVEIAGVTITWVNGWNASYIKKNGIGKGAKIQITRAGDVIPDIVNVKKKANVILPGTCPMCDFKLEWTNSMVDLLCPNPTCPGRSKKQADFFFASLGVRDFAGKTIEKFMEAGYESIEDIVRMTKPEMMQLEGIQDKKSAKIYDGIKAALTNVYWPDLAHATGLFGPSLGSRKLELIWNEYKGDMFDWDSYSKESITEEIMDIKGFDRITAEAFAEGIVPFLQWYRNLKDYITIAPYEGQTSQILDGEIICFTGWRPNSIMRDSIEKNGGKITNSVSKTTTILTVMSKAKMTEKLRKAQELGINIMEKPMFERWLSNRLKG